MLCYTTTTLQSNSPHPYIPTNFYTKIQYGFLPLSFDMQKKELVPLVFSPLNNIQSWPQKHKFFFLLSPKNRKSNQKHSSETIFLCLIKSSLQNRFKICHFCKGINTNPKLLLVFSKSVLVLYFSLTKNSDFFKCPFHQA